MAEFYSVDNLELKGGLGYLIALARKRSIELLDAEFAPLGLTSIQAFVLVGVAHEVTRTAAGFCKVLEHDPGAMTRVVDRLEKAGYLRRVRAAEDRRSVRLELTPAGRRILPKLKGGAAKAFNHMLRGFSRAEANELIRLLKRLTEDA
jgi:DNA-binding MarR family transcriptional regulator